MTLNDYSLLCDDFYLDMYVNTQLELPRQRDTVLAFFERVQKQYPSMGCFYRRENNECYLEEDRGTGRYRWVSLEADCIGSGIVNPSNLEDARKQHEFILELIPYMLSVNALDVDTLDLTFGMDLDCTGNHEEVIIEALGSQSFNYMLDLPNARAVNFSPTMVVSISEDGRTQARISVESKTGLYEHDKDSRKSEDAISLSFTVRQYTGAAGEFDSLRSFENQWQLGQELMTEKIVPNFVRPLTNVITQRRLI